MVIKVLPVTELQPPAAGIVYEIENIPFVAAPIPEIFPVKEFSVNPEPVVLKLPPLTPETVVTEMVEALLQYGLVP